MLNWSPAGWPRPQTRSKSGRLSASALKICKGVFASIGCPAISGAGLPDEMVDFILGVDGVFPEVDAVVEAVEWLFGGVHGGVLSLVRQVKRGRLALAFTWMDSHLEGGTGSTLPARTKRLASVAFWLTDASVSQRKPEPEGLGVEPVGEYSP